MRTTFSTKALAGIAAAGLLLTACGGTDDAADEPTDSSAAMTTEEMTGEDMTSEDMTTEDMATEDMTSEDMTSEDMASEEMTGDDMAMQPVGDACNQIPTDGDGSSAGMADDPVATAASNNPLLSTLVSAVQEADLVDTLNSADALTVFAPINSAFEAIPEEDLNAVMADTDQLTSILTTHVVEGQMDAAALGEADTITNLNGGELTFDPDAMTVTSGDTTANVVCGNVATANATVHLIDTLLMPAS